MTVQPTRDQLRALADKATPGPWEAFHGDIWTDTHGFLLSPGLDDRDAAFIAAARTALPQLLDQLDQAEARIQAARNVLDAEERSMADLDLGACGIGDGWSAAVSVSDIRRALEG